MVELFDAHRAMGEPKRYVYMSEEDSLLYDRVLGREDDDALAIKRLLTRIQRLSVMSHRNAIY